MARSSHPSQCALDSVAPYALAPAENATASMAGCNSLPRCYGGPDALTALAATPSRADKSFSYVLSHDVENRLKEVKKNGVVTATFGYDGDGRMVTATVGVTTTYYVGNYFEKVNAITHTYYYHGGKRIAMRVGNTLYWLLTDHPSVA